MKKNFSKIIALVVAIIAILSITGCGMQPATVPTENKVKISEFGDKATGVEAICKTLKEKEYIPDDNCIKTSANLIGAKSGYRMDGVSVNGSKFSVEIYEFEDTNSELAKSTINSVIENGSFNLFGRTVSYAYMSDNNKYLLIYPDEKSVSDKEKDTENVTRKDEFLKVINSAK
ncbi:MAG: hypothetical protein UHK60_03120 [Acutalibacteraceae bacterium]|nr:hypothetical protein [Acutalibacteraceae bacterium]